MNFQDFANKLKNIVDFIQIENQNFTNENSKEILSLNKEQIFNSLQSDNTNIGFKYSKSTQNINKGKTFKYEGQGRNKTTSDNYFLYDTGAFYDSFRLQSYKDKFIIDADTQKDNIDLMIYGKNILGLADYSLEFLTKKMCENIAKKLTNNYFK